MTPPIKAVKALDQNHIQIELEHDSQNVPQEDIFLNSGAKIHRVNQEGRFLFLETTDLDYRQNYFVKIKGAPKSPVDLGVLLDK